MKGGGVALRELATATDCSRLDCARPQHLSSSLKGRAEQKNNNTPSWLHTVRRVSVYLSLTTASTAFSSSSSRSLEDSKFLKNVHNNIEAQCVHTHTRNKKSRLKNSKLHTWLISFSEFITVRPSLEVERLPTPFPANTHSFRVSYLDDSADAFRV